MNIDLADKTKELDYFSTIESTEEVYDKKEQT
jgi:hypothetical protein